MYYFCKDKNDAIIKEQDKKIQDLKTDISKVKTILYANIENINNAKKENQKKILKI
jgi:hypothetical protein